MRKIYTILILTLFLLGAGQSNVADSTVKKEKRIVETPEQNTAIGEAILRANKAEAKEADWYKKIDSSELSDKSK